MGCVVREFPCVTTHAERRTKNINLNKTSAFSAGTQVALTSGVPCGAPTSTNNLESIMKVWIKSFVISFLFVSLCSVSTASAASFNKSFGGFFHSKPKNIHSLQQPKPTQKALLVLLENGGFTTGLPEEAIIDVWTCGDFEHLSTAAFNLDDLTTGEMFTLLLDGLDGAWSDVISCLNPDNWSIEQVDLIDIAVDVTDAGLETVATTMLQVAGVYDVYDEVVVLEDDAFNVSNVLDEIEALAENYQLDIHVLSHGSQSAFGPTSNFTASSFFIPLQNMDVQIRSVYQQNCYGSKLNQLWINSGALVVNGAKQINYMPTGWGAFLLKWVSGKRFDSSVIGAYNEQRPIFKQIYKRVDLYKGRVARTQPLFNLRADLPQTGGVVTYIVNLIESFWPGSKKKLYNSNIGYGEELRESKMRLKGQRSITINSIR
jgi:hypothetical protein